MNSIISCFGNINKMKNYLLYIILLFSVSFVLANTPNYSVTSTFETIQKERGKKLTEEEVVARGIDIKINEIYSQIEDWVNVRSVARSPIYEMKKGFWWKIIDTVSGKSYIVTVDDDFNLISAVRD